MIEQPIGVDAQAQAAYVIFWAVYAVGFLIFLYLMGRGLKRLPVYGVRTLILACLAVLLLTPVQSPEVVNWWIPAWLHGGYESILGNADEATRAFSNMTLVAAGVFVIWILDLVRVRIWRREA
ncbi:hypothetical protein [Marinobacter sp. JSM 1782161]|uniref:hypothetical protein n=1 Tax=Marinobacter sp. JSM 1782161 TaxID=2685906 RepID=UPI002B1BCF38|nr:hypothetical protein [Marinobacter sp. JSM 1782161]